MPYRPAFKRNPRFVNDVQEMAKAIVDSLFTHEHRYLGEETRAIAIENQSLGGTMNAFFFEGLVHATVDTHRLRGMRIKRLHPSLEARGRRLVSRKERAESDYRRIINALAVVTVRCRTRQDVRDVLPEVIVSLVPALSQMERHRDEGCLVNHSPMLLRQFQDTVDLLLDYQANRLLY